MFQMVSTGASRVLVCRTTLFSRTAFSNVFKVTMTIFKAFSGRAASPAGSYFTVHVASVCLPSLEGENCNVAAKEL